LTFKSANPTKRWSIRKIDVGALDPEGKLKIEEALVLCGNILIASSSANPQALKAVSEPGPTPGVEVLRGTYVKQGRTILCLQFKAPFQVKGRKGTARIIVRLED